MGISQIIFAVILVAIAAALFWIFKSKWLDRESKIFLVAIVCAAAVCSVLFYYVPDALKGPTVALVAATFAAVGWVTTNLQNRKFARIQYTNTQIDHYRNDTELQRCVILIKEHFLNKTPIEAADLDQLWSEYMNSKGYNSSEKKVPVLHNIIHILNFFERVAYLYNNDLIDHRLCYRHFNIILGMQMIRLQNVVRRIRKVDGEKSYNDLHRLMMTWYDFDIDKLDLLTEKIVKTRKIAEFYK